MLTLPFEHVGVGSEGAPLSLCLISQLVFVASSFLALRRCWSKIPKPLIPFGAYCMFFTCRVLCGSPEFLKADLHSALLLLSFLGCFWPLCNCFQWPGVPRVGMLLYGISSLFVAAMPWLGLYQWDFLASDRASTFMQDPNLAAFELTQGILALIGAVWLWGGATILRSLFVSLPSGLMLYAVAMSGSRGAALAAAAGLLSLFLLSKAKTNVTFRGMLLVIVLALPTARVVSEQGSLLERFSRTFYEGDVAHRGTIAREAVAMILQRPLIGAGYSGSRVELAERCSPLDKVLQSEVRSPHNLILSQLTEGGMIGTFLFYSGVFLCLKAAWRERRSPHGGLALSLMLALFTIQLSLSWFWERSFWCFMAFASAASPECFLRWQASPPRALKRSRWQALLSKAKVKTEEHGFADKGPGG